MQKKRNMRGDPGDWGCPPCNGDCNQGRDCPAQRTPSTADDEDDGSLTVVRALAQREGFVMVHATELKELLAQIDELHDRVAALSHYREQAEEENRKW